MSYFSHILHELQVNGQTVDDNDDFNVGEETGAEATADAPAEVADNAAEEANDTAQEDVADNQNAEDETEDDFTIDDTDEEDTDTTEDNTADDEAGNEQPTEDDQNDDFNIDGGTDEDTQDGGNADGGEDQKAPANNTNDQPEDPTDSIDDDDKRAAEEAIYDSLTDDQKRIRVLQLKIDYKDLYETIITTMDGINNIPKTMENLETIKRLITFLTKAKTILIDYVENNFDNNSYLENYTMYIKYLAIFRTTAKVVEELNAIKED